MNDLMEHFVADSLSSLTSLLTAFDQPINESQLAEVYRAVHTVKGTAQTFGLRTAAQLASEVEDELSMPAPDARRVAEGIRRLIGALESPASSSAGESAAGTDTLRAPEGRLLASLPASVREKLSSSELEACAKALRQGKNILSAGIAVAPSALASEYEAVRALLSQFGPVIATMPGSGAPPAGRICLEVLFASSDEPAPDLALRERTGLTIETVTAASAVSFKPAEILAPLIDHGRALSKERQKRIVFEDCSDDLEMSALQASTVFYAFLHLIRNAVTHGIAESGTVRLDLRADAEGLSASVSDDGRGIDLAALRERARELGLDTDAGTGLVFEPGLSTAGDVSDASGRGVGLDAVRRLVESAGGTISVSETGRGTKFEFRLPN